MRSGLLNEEWSIEFLLTTPHLISPNDLISPFQDLHHAYHLSVTSQPLIYVCSCLLMISGTTDMFVTVLDLQIRYPTDGTPWGIHLCGPYPDGKSYLLSWMSGKPSVGMYKHHWCVSACMYITPLVCVLLVFAYHQYVFCFYVHITCMCVLLVCVYCLYVHNTCMCPSQGILTFT